MWREYTINKYYTEYTSNKRIAFFQEIETFLADYYTFITTGYHILLEAEKNSTLSAELISSLLPKPIFVDAIEKTKTKKDIIQ